uniref:Cysteine rich transmembrane BMP regulator 1 (Chordin like) n=1 Tax=Monopterus albus TaxID=43700 RepID=A0A3Q3JSK3_MONAL
MFSKCPVVLLNVLFLVRALSTHECTPCNLRACPFKAPHGCEGGRTLARDPCGCCDQCTRLEWEPCGGQDWAHGYCALGLTCASVNKTGAAIIPETGVCKETGLEDKRCPLITGCDMTGGQCVCDARHSCLGLFTYPDREACMKASKSGEPLCAGVMCSTLRVPSCPKGSVLTKSYTPPADCCPSIPPQCTCNLSACPRPHCPSGHRVVPLSQASGQPGDCCDVFECQKVSPKCVHNGKEFSEGEVYRMDPCWLCQCRAGISFCSKAECAELDCENFYIPEGECCPVCIGTHLSVIIFCWVNNKLRAHEEQWKEDDCTFCQCVDGEPHCTAMACKQSCQNPVKIPGECCPFCEEPSYETVSPMLCPPLENCSLSGTDCPNGFEQDKNGCLLCRCLNSKLLSKFTLNLKMLVSGTDLQMQISEMMCECDVPTPKCRPLTCSKTCPYGYVRNKHGCEMCRCVKCPPFTCDKRCSDGYQRNRKGCSICMCKESGHVLSTTAPAPVLSYCLTSNGRRYKEGDSWHDGCRDCYCHSGREMCVLISCPVPSCSHPFVRHDQCCPTCDDELGSGQLEGMDMVVCRAPGGEFYVEGETWNLDECTRCTCRKGRVLCDSEVCPPALCQTPIRSKDTCCHICPEAIPPVHNSQQEYCITSDGDVLLAGDSWKANACTSCTCNNGTIHCFSQRCPAANCRVPVLRKGQCCPHCLGEYLDKQSADLILTTVTTTMQVTTVPALQTEMALIYQSAAWILAGLLLVIIIFIAVALFFNKKKKWVQMSCYTAPKKAVFLKKHVNKNSVVYMEPSKESKFQNVKNDCGLIPFSPEMSTSFVDKMNIPRAKLGNDWKSH